MLENGSEILYNIEKSERGAEMKNGKICILIADDEKEIRDILRLLPRSAGKLRSEVISAYVELSGYRKEEKEQRKNIGL